MTNSIDNMGFHDFKAKKMRVMIGSKVMKLEVVNDYDSVDETSIRKEYDDKLDNIKVSIKQYVKRLSKDIELKEKELTKKLNESCPMPNVNTVHARQGLSVVKDDYYDDCLIWLYSGVYSPKYVVGGYSYEKKNRIEPAFIKKNTSNITLVVKTKGKQIVSVKTSKPIGLGLFQHYHMMTSGDCWGNWKHAEETWETPDDIIALCRKAETLLETINLDSIANRSPRGLSRLATLKKHLLLNDDVRSTTTTQSNSRIGIDTNNTNTGWSTI